MTHESGEDECTECGGLGVRSVSHKVGEPYRTEICEKCNGTGRTDDKSYYRGVAIGLALMAVVVLGTYVFIVWTCVT